MRPTDIQEKSPRQRTSGFLYPKVTSKGQPLIFPSLLLLPRQNHQKSTFSRSQRFEYIQKLTSRTSPQNGPGRYNTPLSTNNGKGPKMTKETFVEVGYQSSNLYYSGNLLCRKSTPTTPSGRTPNLSKVNSLVSTVSQNTQITIKENTGDMLSKSVVKVEDQNSPQKLKSKRSMSSCMLDESGKNLNKLEEIKEAKSFDPEEYKIKQRPRIHLRSETPRKSTSPKVGPRYFLPKKTFGNYRNSKKREKGLEPN